MRRRVSFRFGRLAAVVGGRAAAGCSLRCSKKTIRMGGCGRVSNEVIVIQSNLERNDKQFVDTN